MPPRALRKLQRQQEQERLAALKQPAEEGGEDSEEEEDEASGPAIAPRQKSAFELLAEAGNDDEDDDLEEQPEAEGDDDDDDVRRSRDAVRESEAEEVTASQPKAKKKKKAKKNKKKVKEAHPPLDTANAAAEDGNDLDDIDRALQELRVQNADKGHDTTSVSAPVALHQFYNFLSIDSKNLKVLNEMKRLFGSSVLEGENEATAGSTGRRRGRGLQQLDLGAALDRRNNPLSRGQGLSERILRKNIFIQGKDSWVKETGGGLGMEVVEQAEDFTTEYRYVHSPTYRRSQQEFDICVESMDPQRMIYFLQMNPYHISGLLQVAEIARQHQEAAVAMDLVERALFSFGRAAHSSFSAAIAEGKARLDFRRPENRELWLAGWRYVRGLGQRGTWRTAYEWAKLLFGLDPESDPYQIRLELDQLAIRAGQFEALVQLASIDQTVIDWGQHQVNIRISLALAHNRLKHPVEARAVLSDAVQRWPWIIARLLKELDIDRIPKSVWGKEPRTPREALHTAAYVTRAKDMWNTPEAVSLLVEVAETTDALPSLPAPETTEIDLNEARHFLVDENPTLLALLPRSFTTDIRTSASDPLPPEDNLPSYTASGVDVAHSESDDDSDSADRDDDENHSAEATGDAVDGGAGFWGWTHRVLGAFGRRPSALAEEDADAAADAARGAEGDSATRRSNREDPQRRRMQAALEEEQRLAAQEDAMLAEAIRQSQLEHETAIERNGRAEAGATVGAAPVSSSSRSHNNDDTVVHPSSTDSSAARPNDNHSQEPARGAVTANLPTPPQHISNDAPSSSPTTTTSTSTETPDDPQRTQRFLAGAGLLALKAFVTAHGADETSWGFGLNDAPAEPVREYVKRAKSLLPAQRRFVLEYALPQGAGKEAGEMVKRLVG